LTGTTSANLTALGVGAAASLTSGSSNTCVGYNAGNSINTGSFNTLVGHAAGDSITDSNWNSMVGYFAGNNVTTGTANTFMGYYAGNGVSTGGLNTALGDSAFYTGNHTNSTCLGYDSGVNGSNQVQLGNSSTTAYAYGAVVDRASDIRDKADVQDTNLGLNFVMSLRPRMYRWDYREDYRPPKPSSNASKEEWDAWREACKIDNLTHNGTHKRTRFHQGLIAQEVKQVMDTMGIDFGGYQDFKIKGGEDRVTIAYGELIGPIIKALQELKAEFDEYKRTHP
jgi:Chaperone of endosialidase